MKKLKLNFDHLGHAEVLTRSQLKKILGGVAGSGYQSGCGVMVNGIWHESGKSSSQTEAMLGWDVMGTDSNLWSDDGFNYHSGDYHGTVTRWCCDHCPWNLPI